MNTLDREFNNCLTIKENWDVSFEVNGGKRIAKLNEGLKNKRGRFLFGFGLFYL